MNAVEEKRFSPDVSQALKDEGYAVYDLTGQSIKSLKEGGREFMSTWHADDPDFEALTSRIVQVAIKPDKFILRADFRRDEWTHDWPLRMLERFTQELRTRRTGVDAVLGEIPDYTELAYLHLDVTGGKRLFSDDYPQANTAVITNTSTTKMRGFPSVAYIEYFSRKYGFYIATFRNDVEIGGLGIAPLIIPASR